MGTVYDRFVIRALDALNYGCNQNTRFMLVGTPSGVTLSREGGAHQSIGAPIAPVVQDACAFFEDHVVIGDQAGTVAVENHAGSDVSKAFKGVKAALHRNNGLLTAARHSIDSAAFWFIALERSSQQQLDIAASEIEPIRIPEVPARYSQEHVGNDCIGWLHFQKIWNHLVIDQPDMFV